MRHAQAEACMELAQRAATDARNGLITAKSWCDAKDGIEDDRDPAAMVRSLLTKAECDLLRALGLCIEARTRFALPEEDPQG